MPDEPEKSGGQGEMLPLSDPHHIRGDAVMVKRAIRERWPIDAEKREKLANRAAELGLADDVDTSAAGLRLVVAMVGQNQADEHLADKNARLDAGLATDRVAHSREMTARELVDEAIRLDAVAFLPAALQPVAQKIIEERKRGLAGS
jgi:hypothetical protein